MTNAKGSSCGRCMKMCPWNKEGLLQHRLAMWAAIKLPWSRRFLIWLDDKMGYGTRGDVNRWWLDLETQKKDGQSFHSDNANARDLSLGRDTSMGNDKVATYPVDKLPRADPEGTGAGRPKAGTERHQGCGRSAAPRSERTPGHGKGQSARLTAPLSSHVGNP